MNTYSLSLRALKYPLTLLSIGLLLLNDHVLKAAAPSWLTGKLSDIAGLFFFPFLLTALLAWPLERLRCPPRRIAALAFGVTLIWFASIKTLPAANQLTARLAGVFVGAPAQIVLDPTDLLALIALWPAWRLWLRVEQTTRPQPPGKAAYLALGLAALATMATAPCMPPPKVVRVATFDGVLYAGLSWQTGGQNAPFAQSSDGGQNWNPLEQVPEEVAAIFRESAAFPLVVCNPTDSQHCYRVAGAEQVDESGDGGQTWQAAWQIPEGRRKFMERWLAQPLSCRADTGLDMGPYDLAFFEQAGREGVIVAMGYQGVLVRTPGGAWERVGIMDADPVPFSGNGLFITLDETIRSLIAACLTLLGLTALAWFIVLNRMRLGWEIVLGRAWLFVLGAVVFGVSLGEIRLLGEIGLVGMLVGILLALLGLFFSWHNVARQVAHPEMVWLAAGVSVAAALVVYFAPTSLFGSWAAGGIAVYEDALRLALFITIPTVVAGLGATVYLCVRAGSAQS